MDLTAVTLSVLVKHLYRSNSSRDGFYSINQTLSIDMTPVKSNYNEPSSHTLDVAYFEFSVIKVDIQPTFYRCEGWSRFSVPEQFRETVAVLVIVIFAHGDRFFTGGCKRGRQHV